MDFGFVVRLRLLGEVIVEVVNIKLFLDECLLDIDRVELEYGFGFVDEGAFSKPEQPAHRLDRIESDH